MAIFNTCNFYPQLRIVFFESPDKYQREYRQESVIFCCGGRGSEGATGAVLRASSGFCSS
jgi:hypothetical protein